MKKNNLIKENIFLPILFLLIFFIYLESLFPAYKNNDSPEIIAAVYTLGICHPPGYPLFINMAKVFSFLPVGNIAFRINMFSGFLAVITLIITYFILKNIAFYFFNKEYKFYSVISVLLLSFSYIFWNQAIEAKGGIYHLNLFFFSAFIYLFIKLLIKFDIRYFYLIILTYSISLTNHWPSMIILFPLIFLVIWIFRFELRLKDIYFIFSFFAIGLTAYVFLLLRAKSMPIINWGNTSEPVAFFEFIIRKQYSGEIVKFSAGIIQHHFKTFFELFLQNYWFLWVLIIPAIHALFKKNKIIFWTFIYILFINFFAIVFYNRTRLEVIWLIKIFLMPFQYIILILISIGIFYIFNRYREITFIFLIIVVLFHAKNNLKINLRALDFFSYDMAFNLFNTIKKDSYYFTEHDMYFFPVLYEQTINKKRLDVKLIPLTFLQFEWGQIQIKKKFNFINFFGTDVFYNYNEMLNQCLTKSDIIYRDFSSELFDKILKINYNAGFSGLLKTISKKYTYESQLFFKLYSLRGFYSSFAQTEENFELIARYMIFSAIQAEKMMNDGRYNEAIYLFNFALRIPVEKLEYLIYYNLSLCYNKLKNSEKELFYLNKCILSKPDFVFAHERLGIYYFNTGFKKEAKIFLENAIKYGTINTKVIELYNDL